MADNNTLWNIGYQTNGEESVIFGVPTVPTVLVYVGNHHHHQRLFTSTHTAGNREQENQDQPATS